MSMVFDVRRVVTGHDPSGRPVLLSDGTPPATRESPTGAAVSDLWWIDGPPADGAAGGDRSGPSVLEPPPGGFSWRIVRLPPGDGQWQRVHATNTVDLMWVLDGQIVLGLDDGEHALTAGDTVVQRGTAHRWQVVGDQPCTYMVLMMGVDPAATPPAVALEPRATEAPSGLAPRRLVTATDASGRSFAALDSEPPLVFLPSGPGGSVMVDLWQTGGPVVRADQGGDLKGPWELDPAGRGVAFRLAELPPGRDPSSRGWHTTPSIDLDIILSGHIEMAIPGFDPVVLGPGDTVVMGATEHRWQTLGDEPARMGAVMIYVPA